MNALQRHWSSFVSFATALCALFSGFLIPVPSAGEENLWFKYGRFLVAVCIGLWFVPEQTWSHREHKWHWWCVALTFVLGSSTCVFHYTQQVDRWTIPYWRDRRVVIGQTLNKDMKDYLQAHPGAHASPLDLLNSVVGNPYRVWDAGEIESRQRKLELLYLLTMFLLSSTVVTVAQAACCSTRKKLPISRKRGIVQNSAGEAVPTDHARHESKDNSK
jgi:hypothetical protein